MKSIKRIASLLLALVMALAMSVIALAAENTGSITVENPADGVTYTAQAEKDLREIEALGADRLPICVAKTQYSLSDDPALLGRPEGFRITVRSLRLSNGAGFIVALTGNIMTMPGLPKEPAALRIDIDRDGKIKGLF